MFCKKCGSEISASDETCPKCGTFVSDKFATEKYDPLLALDKVENIEDNVIWQEAPVDVDTIILNAGDLSKNSEPLIKENKSTADESVQNVQKEEKHFKENITQGIRAAKSTISHPIKPRKRIKPKESPKIETPTLNVNTQNEDVIITESFENVEEQVINETPVAEKVVEEAPIIQETVVEEVPTVEEVPVVQQRVVEEEITEKTPITENLTDSVEADDEVIDLFDDFVVDDSIAIIDETPEIIEEVPVEEVPKAEEPTEVVENVAEETPIVEEAVIEETSVVEEVPVVEEEVIEEVPVVEETPIVQQSVVEETPIVEDAVVEEVPVIDEFVEEPEFDNEFTSDDAIFEEVFFEREPAFEPIAETPIETPIMEEVQTKLEEIAKTEEKAETIEKPFTEKSTATGIEVAGASVAGAASRAQHNIIEKSEEDVDDKILKSVDTKSYEDELKTVEDDRETAIKSKFNTTFGTEDEEDLDVDENINNLTSKITTFLIILLILIIAIVVATFLLQRIGL